MTGAEQGLLLLTSVLGDSDRKPLTVAQFRTLTQRVRQSVPSHENRELQTDDLVKLGYDEEFACRVLTLLCEKEKLYNYVQKASQFDCYPITRRAEHYPDTLRKILGDEAPGSLWAKGDMSILNLPGVALVGSRNLLDANKAFAYEVGKQAALHGLVLISGNARGADCVAQESALAHGGKVISIIADSLKKCPVRKNIIYLSEDGFDMPFSAQRALFRNRLIHAMGEKVFVAQCNLYKGGTWSGTVKNLQQGKRAVFCFADGSDAVSELVQKGARAIGADKLAACIEEK